MQAIHKAGSIFENQLMHFTISTSHGREITSIEKSFDKIQQLFMIKTLSTLRIEGNLLHFTMRIYTKTTATNILFIKWIKTYVYGCPFRTNLLFITKYLYTSFNDFFGALPILFL